MDAQWLIAIISWVLILGVLAFLLVREWCMTPERKQDERQKATTRYEAHKAAKQQEKQQRKNTPMPNYGCLYKIVSNIVLYLLVLGGLLLVFLIFAIRD